MVSGVGATDDGRAGSVRVGTELRVLKEEIFERSLLERKIHQAQTWHWVLPLGVVVLTVAVFGCAMSKESKPSRIWQMSEVNLQTERVQGDESLSELLK